MTERDQHVAEINRRLKEKGFEPGELQAALRGLSGDHLAPFTTQEIELGLLDAFSNMGGATVWCGDGSSCAVQIVEHQIALAESASTGAEEEIERLKAENASLLESLRAAKEQTERWVCREAALVERGIRTDADQLSEKQDLEHRLAAAEQRAEAAEKRCCELSAELEQERKWHYEQSDKAAAAEKRSTDLMVAIRAAPHGGMCATYTITEGSPPLSRMDPLQTFRSRLPPDEAFCGCWKRAALHDEERSAPPPISETVSETIPEAHPQRGSATIHETNSAAQGEEK